ncbi:MAG: hypothetical protein ABI083_18705 [Lapillicoccus sp.]
MRRSTRYAAVLALLSVAVLTVAVVQWRGAETDPGLAYAALRDRVTVQGRQDIVVMNSLDTTQVDAGLAAWLSVTTGTLHDQLGQVSATDKTSLASAGAKTTGKVVDAVLTELDDRAGTARMIASVELDVVDKAGKASVKRNRFSADLTLDGSQWKLSQLQQVAVNAS